MRSSRLKLLVKTLRERDLTITAAESCTGGRIASAVTSVPGSSRVFPGGVVSYCDEIKHRVLGVPETLLKDFGAVSAPVAREMARGAAELMGADLALSATGIAGPDGDGSRNPVGTVWLSLYAGGICRCEKHVFPGDRAAVQEEAADRALEMACEYLGI